MGVARVEGRRRRGRVAAAGRVAAVAGGVERVREEPLAPQAVELRPLRRLLGEQRADRRPRGLRQRAEPRRLVEDVPEQIARPFRLEGRRPRAHLVEQDAQAPVVHGAVVGRAALEEELRRHVDQRARERPRPAPRGVVAVRGQAKVREEGAPASIQEHVRRLDVAVDDARRVEVAHGERDARAVARGLGLAERPRGREPRVQRPALVVGRHQVQPRAALEAVAEVDEARVAHGPQHLLLDARRLLQIPVRELALAHDLHGEGRAGVGAALAPHEHDGAEGALAEEAQGLEVARGVALVAHLARHAGNRRRLRHGRGRRRREALARPLQRTALAEGHGRHYRPSQPNFHGLAGGE